MSTITTEVDVRGPRFAAWITSAMLVVALLVSAFSAPIAAKAKPTSWANFRGGTGSRSVTGPKCGATTVA